jgi:uncharacterized protein YjbI with pentapeptide repeats
MAEDPEVPRRGDGTPVPVTIVELPAEKRSWLKTVGKVFAAVTVITGLVGFVYTTTGFLRTLEEREREAERAREEYAKDRAAFLETQKRADDRARMIVDAAARRLNDEVAALRGFHEEGLKAANERLDRLLAGERERYRDQLAETRKLFDERQRAEAERHRQALAAERERSENSRKALARQHESDLAEARSLTETQREQNELLRSDNERMRKALDEERVDRLYGLLASGRLDGAVLKDVLERIRDASDKGSLLAQDLSERCISGVDLSSASAGPDARLSLRGLGLRESLAEGSRFDHADLREADFRYARLDGSSFAGANLAGAKLWSANVNRCDFSGADLRLTDVSVRQLASACGSRETMLPEGRERPDHWDLPIEQQAAQVIEWHFTPGQWTGFRARFRLSRITPSISGDKRIPESTSDLGYEFSLAHFWRSRRTRIMDWLGIGRPNDEYGWGRYVGVGLAASSHEWGGTTGLDDEEYYVYRIGADFEYGVTGDVDRHLSLEAGVALGARWFHGHNEGRLGVEGRNYDRLGLPARLRVAGTYDWDEWGGWLLGVEAGGGWEFLPRLPLNGELETVVDHWFGGIFVATRF